jgi:glucose/arabinose dehydrogenase
MYFFIFQKQLKTTSLCKEQSLQILLGWAAATTYSYESDSNSGSSCNAGSKSSRGKIVIGLDNYCLYTAIGDLNNEGQLQNFENGPEPIDSSVILKVSPLDGSPANDNPFLTSQNPNMNKYYAYAVRNTFGLGIDPITGALWEAENGDEDYDEINLVRPGFNNGWKKLMGSISESDDISQEDLVNFPGSHYADPVFS